MCCLFCGLFHALPAMYWHRRTSNCLQRIVASRKQDCLFKIGPKDIHQTPLTARKQLGVLRTGRQCHREEATSLLMISTLPLTQQPLPLSQLCRNCLRCVLPVLTHLTMPKFSLSSLNLARPTKAPLVIEVMLPPSSLTLQCLTIITSIDPF